MTDDWLKVWHPVATTQDLPQRHVFQGKLLGRELAVWRAEDDFVNVWENRCLHRGVRLSIGINDGRELRCQYHGWRYANRTAGCTYIPAHPADAPAQTICNRTFPAIERYGLVWSGEDPSGELPSIAVLDGGNPFDTGAKVVTADGVDTIPAEKMPAKGYTIINAKDMDEATEVAKGCPALEDDPEGAVRVYEAMPM